MLFAGLRRWPIRMPALPLAGLLLLLLLLRLVAATPRLSGGSALTTAPPAVAAPTAIAAPALRAQGRDLRPRLVLVHYGRRHTTLSDGQGGENVVSHGQNRDVVVLH